MKTLAVLSALATLAIAAPTFEEKTESSRLSTNDFTISQQREKKSTTLESLNQKAPEHLEDHGSEKISNNFETSNSVARTFSSFKKPIIVKKKIGYHLYRDSEEEQSQADPRESCRKQIKVKLCDDNNSMDKVKSASIDQTHDEISEREMEHSINMAKEAVETFQRDLQKMEHDSTENINHRRTPLGSDTELHEDIEKARQALEHIHRKFKNLDSATANEDERDSKIHLKSIQVDDKEIAQWKEAGNLHKNVEIAKNLEDNFKSTNEDDISKQLNVDKFARNLNEEGKNLKTTDDKDTLTNSHLRVEDSMTSIIEDKIPKMKIQSDNLIKGNVDETNQEKGEKLSKLEHHAQEQKESLEKNAGNNEHENVNHNFGGQVTSELAAKEKEITLKPVDNQGNDLKRLEQLSRDNIDHNEMMKSNDGIPSFVNQPKTKLESELHNEHLHTRSAQALDQATHESKNIKVISNTNTGKSIDSEDTEKMNKDVTKHNTMNKEHLDNDNFEQRAMILKNTDSVSHNQEHLRNDLPIKELDLQRATQIENTPMNSEVHNLKNKDVNNMESLKSSLATSDNEDSIWKSHSKNVDGNGQILQEHQASSDFNKELLKNINQPHHTEADHILKNENLELRERLTSLTPVHSNSENLHTNMHVSDNGHHQSPQTKMASMLSNNQPNINVQFNSPQDFIEDTNVQEVMPFRAMGDIHNKELHNMGFDEKVATMHEKDIIPTDMHDPLTIRWAHENAVNSEKLKAASQFHQENMRMDGSSQHFNFEKLPPSRSLINDDHLSLHEQIRAHQRWPQAKSINTQHLSPMNSGFDHTHEMFTSRNKDHNMMIHENSNIDNTMQPSSFAQMRGTPKMALEYTNPNQWNHNHGAFRSSYGPVMNPSYGSGGGSASSGSAVGVFPNANVGNCAVPILLSCSPSVVSGSLAKTQSTQNTYAAPSYRSEDINYLKKRGIDVDQLSPGLKLQRLAQLGHRPNVILDKKQ